MRKLYWYVTAYWRKHGRIFLTSIVVLVLLFSVSLPIILSKIEFKNRQFVGVVGSYNLRSLPPEIQEKISFGLTKVEPDGTVSPAASARWSIEDDNTTYRFIIKQNLLWQDGKPVEPTDVNYELEDTQIIKTAGDVVFKLPNVFVPFPAIVSQPLYRTIREPYLFFFSREKILGLGEYQVLSYSLQHSRLKELVLDAKNERLTYRFYLTENDAVIAFKRGEVDSIINLTQEHDIGGWPNVTINKHLLNNHYLALFFDTNKPYLKKNVRQALSYILQKPIKPLRAIGPISPDSWVYLDAAKSYDYDQERARERLLSELPDQKLEFSLTTTPNFIAEAEAIKQQFEEFGGHAYEVCKSSDEVEDDQKDKCENIKIQIEIKISNFPDTQNFDTLLIAQESPADPDQYALWHSDQTTNLTNYKNTRIDNLLEKGRQVAQREERKTIYQEFQQFLLEDAPAIFIKHLEAYEISRQ